jgi:hypothetical protein
VRKYDPIMAMIAGSNPSSSDVCSSFGEREDKVASVNRKKNTKKVPRFAQNLVKNLHRIIYFLKVLDIIFRNGNF